MHPCGEQIERHHRDLGEELLDECLPPAALRGLGSSMDAMKKLGRGDRRQDDRLVGALLDEGSQVELASLSSDEDAGVDQRGHGDFRAGGWRLVACSTDLQ